jgi:GNAT superfamily N-acetyltransferase
MEQLSILAGRDAGEVLTLQRAAYVSEAQAHRDLELPALRQTLPELATELTDPEVLALGLRDADGRLVAAVRAALGQPEPAVAAVSRLSVVPDRQGQGLGTRLLARLEERLPARITELRLFTGEHSSANLRLYRRLGYVETHRTPAAAGYALVHMSKLRAQVSADYALRS